MTLREQVEALPGWHFHDAVERQAVLDLIDAHRCLDPERLARALRRYHGCRRKVCEMHSEMARDIAAAYEEQE